MTVPYTTITGFVALTASIAAVLIASRSLCNKITSNQGEIHFVLVVFENVFHPFHHHVIIDLNIVQLEVYHQRAASPYPDITEYTG